MTRAAKPHLYKDLFDTTSRWSFLVQRAPIRSSWTSSFKQWVIIFVRVRQSTSKQCLLMTHTEKPGLPYLRVSRFIIYGKSSILRAWWLWVISTAVWNSERSKLKFTNTELLLICLRCLKLWMGFWPRQEIECRSLWLIIRVGQWL